MNAAALESFCTEFFRATGCKILSAPPGFLEVELTRPVDKQLTDRPYYWMWVEATGEEVPPTILRLSFDPNASAPTEDKWEAALLGSFRMNKIMDAAKELGKCSQMYERVNSGGLLWPMLVVRTRVSHVADRSLQHMRTFGIDLVRGSVFEHCDAWLRRDFMEQPPARANMVEPRMTLQDGWLALREDIVSFVRQDDTSWTLEARERLVEELQMLEMYYASLERTESNDRTALARERQVRVAEVDWRCRPRVEIEPAQLALLYVDPPHFLRASLPEGDPR